MNSVTLVGRLARDPDLRFVSGSGTANCKFQIAVDKSKGEGANFLTIVAWGKTAENCAQYLKKGSQVAVIGSYQTGSYETKEGEKKYTKEVLASRIEFLSKSNNSSTTEEAQYNDFATMEDEDDVPF